MNDHCRPARTPAAVSCAALVAAAVLAGCSRPEAFPDFATLMETQGPAVVNIVSLRAGEASSSDPSGKPAPAALALHSHPSRPAMDDLGSGVIIGADGLILTNAHLVGNAKSITVRLADGRREYPARLLGSDPDSDIAVIDIDAEDLPVARLGRSSSVGPGEWVAAIGSPFGFTNTITAGIVSATGRSLSTYGGMPFIQSDVAVNPGSSGGPLLNRRGEVVGINSMIFSPTGAYLGLSFAIPIEIALDVAHRLARDGSTRRGRLGVSLQPLSPELAQAFGVDGQGMLVSLVEPDGPAARAGLRAGDVIAGFADGEAADEDLLRRIAAAEPGSRRTLAFWRERRLMQAAVTIGEHPVEPGPAPAPGEAAAKPQHAGLVLSDLSPELARHLGIPFGLRVVQAPPAEIDDAIRYGDVITMVGTRAFDSREQFEALLSEAREGFAPVLVRRGKATVYVVVPVPERLREAG